MRILLHDFLLSSAQCLPDKVALRCEDRAITFAGFASAASGLAATLRRQGVRRGDRVMLFMDNSIEMAVAVFATSMAGGVFVPVNPTTKADKLGYLIGDCAPRVLIAGQSLARVVRGSGLPGGSVSAIIWHGGPPASPILADRELTWGQAMEAALDAPEPALIDPALIDQDLACIIYTSGSTGDAKGVMLTHRNITNTAWAISTYLGNVPSDVVLCVLPMSFDYGLYQVVTGARVGFTVVLSNFFAYPWRVIETMAAHRVTGLPGVPTLFAQLLQLTSFEGQDLSALRYLTNTAAALPPAHIRRLCAQFPQARLFSMYGLTECTRVSWLDPARLHDKIGTVGQGMPNSEVYVIGADGCRLPPGEVGELVVRGAHVMRGYWRKPEATARRLRDGEIAGEKVLHTGDLFRMDEEGFLTFVGRVDDIFKCRGEKVSPKEVERVLCEMPGIAEAAVVPVPDAIDGMAIKAVVVPVAGVEPPTESAVRLFCRGHLESYLVPRFVEVRSSLPRSENGKVRRGLLVSAPPAQEAGAQQ